MPGDPAAANVAALRRALLAVIADSALPDLSVRQLAVLIAAASAGQPSSVGGLAAAIGMRPTAVSRSLDRLVAAGLMARLRGPGGGAAWRTHPTDKGRACVMLMRAALANAAAPA